MKNLFAALLAAQREFTPVPKDASNPAFRSRYATLGAVQETAFPVLHKHGLLVLQSVRTDWAERGPIVYVGAALVHAESGEQMAQEIGLVPAKVDPQGVGSAISYGRRYLLLTMLGLSAEDDDGGGAASSGSQQQQFARPVQQPQQPQPQPQANDITAHPQFKRMHALGREVFGDAWRNGQGREFIRNTTGKESTKELSLVEIANVIAALENVRADDVAGQDVVFDGPAAQPALVATPPAKKGKRPEYS